MPNRILIDAFYLSVLIPKGLPESESMAIRRHLRQTRFRADLTKAIRGVFRRKASLRNVHITLTR